MTYQRSRISAANGRIVITGTGRAGTTFLVQLFSALGFDTGFSLAEAVTNVDAISHAGLERPLVDENNPYVIKSPWFADQLMEALENRRVHIYTAVVPVRDLYEAAESRRRVYSEASARGLDPLTHPGTLWYTDKPAEQEDRLARQFFKAIFPLIKYEVPTILLEFPRIVRDDVYLFQKMARIMDDHQVSMVEFTAAHAKVARPDIIHEFK